MNVQKQRGRAGGVLSHEEAKAFYDRFGRKQDLQRIYEDPAIEALLLEELLPDDPKYLGLDISQTMIDLAQGRVAPWADRARVQRTDGSPTFSCFEKQLSKSAVSSSVCLPCCAAHSRS